MKIKGIADFIVQRMIDRSNSLSQGRSVGALGFVNEDGYIDAVSELVDGGISGIPHRKMLSKVVETEGKSLLESLDQLPERTVVITTDPGKTGIIVKTSGINILGCPIVNIGIKMKELAGVGLIYPKQDYFELTTESERVQLERLTADTMDEEREVLRKSAHQRLEYLEICEELETVGVEERELEFKQPPKELWEIPYIEVESVDCEFAAKLVDKSLEVERGREVAALGKIEDGHITQAGEVVVGGMGYVPSRLLASSYTDISGKSLREVYRDIIPNNLAIVHTHPGGTGVMHRGDAMAGPGTWGRPVVAIGHDKQGTIQGVTTIELLPEVAELADESEDLGQEYYEASTPEEEAEIRKRRFGISQEYTDLCKSIEMK